MQWPLLRQVLVGIETRIGYSPRLALGHALENLSLYQLQRLPENGIIVLNIVSWLAFAQRVFKFHGT